MTTAQQEELVTGAEIGRRLGITRSRVAQLAQRSDFPQPVLRASNIAVWRWADVATWADGWERRAGRPRTPSP